MLKQKEETADQFWNKQAKNLKGKVIKEAKYMTHEEAEEFGWHSRPVVIHFTDGTYIIPMKDDEGNDGGSVEGSNDDLVFPVLR
tara:strand:+ start:988 stop:1239 length:252 start_codon:yes stop_codon:yes gene_type:complete